LNLADGVAGVAHARLTTAQAEPQKLQAALWSFEHLEVSEGGEVGAVDADDHALLVVFQSQREGGQDGLVEEGEVQAEGHQLQRVAVRLHDQLGNRLVVAVPHQSQRPLSKHFPQRIPGELEHE
jgi:hypothetical protein